MLPAKFDMSQARVMVMDTFFTDFTWQIINVERLIRDLKNAHINCLRLAAYSHLGFTIYPSKIAPMFPGLDEDLFGNIVKACHNSDIAVIAYINAGFDSVLEESKEYTARMSAANGNKYRFWASDTPPWGVRWLCFNQKKTHDLLGGIIDEVMDYSVEGAYYDETAEGFCHCDTCRKRYRKETGREMPEIDHWADEKLWNDLKIAHEYMNYRKRVLLEWRKWLVKRTKKYGQNKIAMINCGGYPQRTANSLGASTIDTMDFIDGFLTESMLRAAGCGIHHAGFNSRFAENTPFHPWVHVELKSSSWTFDVAPKEELMVKTGMLVAHGARPAAYTYHQNGQTNTLATLEPVYARVALNENILSETISAAQIGLLYSRNSEFAIGKNDKEYGNEFEGIYSLLEHSHVCFDIIDPILTKDVMDKFRVLVLSSPAVLSKQEQNALRNYISQGGNILVSGQCATHTSLGQELPNSTLADVLGCNILGRRNDSIPVNAGGSKEGRRCYFHLITNHPIFEEMEPDSWHPKSSQSFMAELTTGQSLADTVLCPNKPPCLGPGNFLDYPSIVINQYGRGMVVYLPWEPGGVYKKDEPHGLLKLYRSAIRWLLGGKQIARLDAPCEIELSLRKKEGKFIFHMIDYTGSHKILHEKGLATISGSLRLPDSRNVTSIRTLDGQNVQWKQIQNGTIDFEVPIDRWQALIIE